VKSGFRLGVKSGLMLGVNWGFILGVKSGLMLGVKSGLRLGVKVGLMLGVKSGFILGVNFGLMDGVTLGFLLAGIVSGSAALAVMVRTKKSSSALPVKYTMRIVFMVSLTSNSAISREAPTLAPAFSVASHCWEASHIRQDGVSYAWTARSHPLS